MILRHNQQPERISAKLREDGWAPINDAVSLNQNTSSAPAINENMSSNSFKIQFGSIELSGIITIPESNNTPPLVIILTGWKSPCSKQTYLDFERIALENRYAVIRYDHPGHGESGGKLEDITIPLATDALAKIVSHAQEYQEQIDVGSITLIAGSLAAEIAMSYTPRDEKVQKLVLVSPGFGKDTSRTDGNVSREVFWNDISGFVGKSFAERKELLGSEGADCKICSNRIRSN